MSISLYPHNQTAYDSAVEMLNEAGRAAIVHPTGTGKSYIGFKLVEQNPNCLFLWLSPSEYIFKSQMDNLSAKDKSFPEENIKFYTYASLIMMENEEVKALRPDYIILDEFHRCGAKRWGQGVQKLLNLFPNVPVLGLSATAIRYLDSNRNMAEELFAGNVASEMTLGEAVVRGILPAPTYVSTLFKYQNELRQYQSRVDSMRSRGIRDINQKYLDALRRALEKSDGLDVIFKKYMTDKSGKYIVFCSNVGHMQEMIGHVTEWFGSIDRKPSVYMVYADSANSRREFELFKNDQSEHLKLLFCIDMLNEGVHIAGISGVILFRPTVSPIIFKQQIGRALTTGEEAVPLIIDVVNNMESIRSIDSLQEEMSAAVLWLRTNGRGEDIVNERFQVIDQLQSCRELFDKLESRLNSSWEQYFMEAKAFSEKHGNSLLTMPNRYISPNGLNVGYWIMTQKRVRSGRQNGKLTEEQIRRLDSIGMIWENRLEVQFQQNYEYAREYYEQYGDLMVPASYRTKSGFRLGVWICNLRRQYVNGEQTGILNAERIEQLNEIGMCWDAHSYLWEKKYLEALTYYREHGSIANVPCDYKTESGVALGAWLNSQKNARKGKAKRRALTEDQIRRLDEIGMCWGSRYDEMWMRGFEAARQYYQKYHDLSCVPLNYRAPNGVLLRRWVVRQQYAFEHPEKSGTKLDAKRMHLLNTIGLPLDTRTPWQKKFDIAQRYYKEHMTIDISQDEVFEGVWIGKWLAQQRKAYKNGTLSRQQIEGLELLGFDWRTKSERRWQEHFEEAKEYRLKNGHLKVPSSNGGLGKWLKTQRNYRRKGILSEERICMLTELDMDWGD